MREILGDQLHQQSSKFNLRLGSGVQRTKTRSKAAASSTISCRSGCWGTSSATHLRQGRAKSLSWAFICVFKAKKLRAQQSAWTCPLQGSECSESRLHAGKTAQKWSLPRSHSLCGREGGRTRWGCGDWCSLGVGPCFGLDCSTAATLKLLGSRFGGLILLHTLLSQGLVALGTLRSLVALTDKLIAKRGCTLGRFSWNALAKAHLSAVHERYYNLISRVPRLRYMPCLG